MNILTKIQSDHQEIRRLIEAAKSQSSKNPSDQRKAYDHLKEWVMVHHDAEQHTLLTELVKHDSSREKAMHLVEEHGEHKKLLELMDDASPSDHDWESKFEHLSHELLHHIEEEEGDLFKLCRETLDEETLNKIGQAMVLETAKLSPDP